MHWLLTRGRFPYLALLALLVGWLGIHATRVGIEYDNDSLNTRDPLQESLYDHFKSTFGSDEDLLLALSHPHLLDAAGLQLVASLTERIAAIHGVEHAYSLTNARRIVAGDHGAEIAPVIEPPFDRPAATAALAAALREDPGLTGLFVSADRRVAGILIELEERSHDHQYRADVIDELRRLMSETREDGIELHLTGIAVQKNDVSAYVVRDQRVLIPLAIVVLAAVLAVFFRSIIGIVLPLTVTAASVAVTLGLYQLAGLEMNAITALLPPIVMVLSVTVSVHLIQRWRSSSTAPRENIVRIEEVVRQLRFPCLFCALTTALGFGSLAASDTPAVQHFGIFAAIGALVSFVTGMTLVPVGLTLARPPQVRPARGLHRLMERVLEHCAALVTSHPHRALAVAVALTLVSMAGLPFVRNNTDLVGFLRSDAPLVGDTTFIDQRLTGANTLEYVVTRRDDAPMIGREDVERMAAFETEILSAPQVTGVSSVLVALRQIGRAESDASELRLPVTDRDTAYAFDLIEAAPDKGLLDKLVSSDFTEARFNVRIHAIGTAEAAPLASRIEERGRQVFGDDYRLAATGAFYHLVEDSNRLVRAQVRSFSMALVLVFAAIGFLFRSPILTIVALTVNVMPIAWTGGLMGAFGIDLSTGTAMIASAVLGLVVDDTIHYLTHFYRSAPSDPAHAVRATTTEIGTVLMMNNLVLILGFWVGCFGSFKPTIYFSLLSGVTMLSALFADLLVTPACLLLLSRRRAGRLRAPGSFGLVLACSLVFGVAIADADESAEFTGLLDAAGDEVIASVAVPSTAQQVGEVRLIRRGDADVVQTLLHTKLLERAVAEIGEKERANWPAETTGHADAERYLEALATVSKRMRDEQAPFLRHGDRRQKMLIEFAIDATRAVVAVGTFDMVEAGNGRRVTEPHPYEILGLSREYVRRNMRLIAADSFHAQGRALEDLLAQFEQLSETTDDGGS